jgi:D-Tyr-tRNAtyr deacylase
MNTKLIKFSGLAIAMVCSAVMAETALAQGPGPRQSPATPNQGARPMQGQMMQRGMMMRGQMGGMDESLAAISANVLGISQTDLIAALKSGKTIADVAKEKSVDPAKIVNAFVTEKLADRQAMVTSGRWTQAQLDQMKTMMQANVSLKITQPFTVQGNGTGWVDANGDGKCDNMPADQTQPMRHRGPGGWNS